MCYPRKQVGGQAIYYGERRAGPEVQDWILKYLPGSAVVASADRISKAGMGLTWIKDFI